MAICRIDFDIDKTRALQKQSEIFLLHCEISALAPTEKVSYGMQ